MQKREWMYIFDKDKSKNNKLITGTRFLRGNLNMEKTMGDNDTKSTIIGEYKDGSQSKCPKKRFTLKTLIKWLESASVGRYSKMP